MDGDRQNDPADIALLLDGFDRESGRSGGRVAVLGQRAVRNDSGLRRLSSGSPTGCARGCWPTARATPAAA